MTDTSQPVDAWANLMAKVAASGIRNAASDSNWHGERSDICWEADDVVAWLNVHAHLIERNRFAVESVVPDWTETLARALATVDGHSCFTAGTPAIEAVREPSRAAYRARAVAVQNEIARLAKQEGDR